MKAKQIARQIAVLLFGVVFPLVVLVQAYQGIASLNNNVGYNTTVEDLVGHFSKTKSSLSTENDYALFSLLYVEHANQKTMINKQIMKVAIVHIGFAVISIGMMLIILGINDSGMEGKASANGIDFDFKTGSTGVAVFVIGAIMSTAGGVLKNDYQTSEIPMYSGTIKSSSKGAKYNEIVNAYQVCEEQTETPTKDCFMQIFKQISKSDIK